MSEDPSTISKDPNKVSKKKNSGTNSDFKQQPRKGSKDYQVYFEPKGSEKSSKDQANAGKTTSPSTNQDEHQGPKNSNKQKSHAKNRKESRDQGWKKKYPRVSKELIIEFYLKAPAYTDIDELVSTCSQLFVKDKLIPVNKEDNQLDPNEGLILKNSYPPATHNAAQGHSNPNAQTETYSSRKQSHDIAITTPINGNASNVTNTTTNASTIGFVRSTMQTAPSSTKPAELAEAPVNLNDPIQAMRERMKKDKANKEKKEAALKAENASVEGKLKEENAGDARKESQEEAHANTEEKENKNINSQEVPTQKSIAQKESLKEDNTKTALENSQAEKERKEETGALQAQNEARSPTRDSGADFSKLSFDAGNKRSPSDDLSSQQGDASRYAQQRAYEENANLLAGNNPNYDNQELNQNNMYRGASNQEIQQINTQYVNKGNMQEQASPRRQSPGSLTNIPKVLPQTFVFKYFSPNYDDKVWSYVDLEGKFQGPFSGRTMDEWLSKGYLPVELNVTIGKGNGFKALKDLVDIIENHNTQAQAESPMAKTQTPPKMQAQDYQYQQQQHQQQQQYYQQQQQQQYPQQYQQQQTQQQRQQQQYQQQQQQYPQQQAQYNQQQKAYYQQQQQQDPRSYQEYTQYGSTTPTASANRNKAMEGFDSSNAYYGNQGASSQYGSQGNVIYGKVTEIDPQAHTYYSNTQYYNQESTPKSGAAYGNYKQGANVNANTNAYYQDSNAISGYNQPAYNQPQKQQVKANYPTQMQQQNYPTGGNQMGSYGGNFGGQSAGMGGQGRDYSNYGGNTGNMNNAQMYSMQQQQQMMNKGAGMGANAGMPSDMTMHLKSMLGVARPSSRQEGHEY